MVRFAFMATAILILVVQSQFTQTEEIVEAERRIFHYNFVAWIFLGLFAGMFLVYAEIGRRFMRDRWIAASLVLLMFVLLGFLAPQLVLERTEITPALLIHRREPPHTKFNVDVEWKSIQSAVKIEKIAQGFFGEPDNIIGYELTLRDGSVQELPANTVLTRAQDEIDRSLFANGIPVQKKQVPRARR